MSGLLTDLYELTMSAGFWETGKWDEAAVFEMSVRRLPRNRNYVLAAGLEQAVEYLLRLEFGDAEIVYLRGLPQFSRVSPGFFDALRAFRFRGDVDAVEEGTTLFAGEPVMRVRATLPQGQIPETYLLSTITFQTLIASKAARVVNSAAGRAVVEFGTRRAHTPEAGVLGARAAYLAGCSGTSNTLAGYRYGIPALGTAAHSWILAFPAEHEAFRAMQQVLGPSTVHLVDTYDTEEGVRIAASLGEPLWGIRIDSGDFVELSTRARRILDDAGLRQAKIMVSGDLDEHRIREMLDAGAPVDAFGVGTELATSADAPAMGAIYKLAEIDGKPVAKRSAGKSTLPGSKQIFRHRTRDVIGLEMESCPPGARPLLQPVLRNGALVRPQPSLMEIRERAAEALAALPARYHDLDVVEPYPVELSPALRALAEP
ncbi:MAG: nicotinate phosphoribosyltransferase [Bryobacteraceae bacterium]